MAAFPFRPRSSLCDSHAEERASMLTHAFGILFSVASLIAMIMVAGSDPYRLVAAIVFGISLILLYSSSTLYHSLTSPRLKATFQALDHACIYLLIAGSYTPLTLVALRGPWGWTLFGCVWFLAIAGVILKSCMREKRDAWWSTALYILMGWLAIFAIGPLIRAMSPAGIAWLVAGGLCYTLGVIFYAWNRLRYNHAIWHLFVIAGSACHVIATIGYILP